MRHAYATKTDANHAAICRLLAQIPGVSVADTSGAGDGFPDLVVGLRGISYLIELKDGAKSASRRKLTPAQVKFQQTWTGQYAVCKDFDEVLAVLQL